MIQVTPVPSGTTACPIPPETMPCLIPSETTPCPIPPEITPCPISPLNRHVAFLLKQCHVPFLLELRATSLSSWNGLLSSHFLIRRGSDVDNYPLLGIVFLFFMGSWTSTELSPRPRSPATTLLQHCADGVAEKTSLWGRSGGRGGGLVIIYGASFPPVVDLRLKRFYSSFSGKKLLFVS